MRVNPNLIYNKSEDYSRDIKMKVVLTNDFARRGIMR